MKLTSTVLGTTLRTLPLLPALLAASASAGPAARPGDGRGTDAAGHAYGVVNLAPGAGVAMLNRWGQAAFSTDGAGRKFNGFFDGARVVPVEAADGQDVQVNGLNDRGVVVGQSGDRAFVWTLGGGMRPLPGQGGGGARAVNLRNQVAGSVRGGALYGRAWRWNADGTTTALGPLPATLSEAVAIDAAGVAVGYADVALHDSHAMVWDALGRTVDLGTMGGTQSAAQFINARGQVAGSYFRDGVPGAFLWTRAGGAVKIAPAAAAGVRLTALNDLGEVAVNLPAGDGNGPAATPFVWSNGRLRALPLGGAAHGVVNAINNRNAMVGAVERASDAPAQRAVLWRGTAGPLDLNRSLVHAPASLVLYAGRAINDAGDILADSNAGLVLLRPGARGTDAPVLGPIEGAAPDGVVPLNEPVDLRVAFTDSNASETHAAQAAVDDGCPAGAAQLREVRGSGVVDVRHAFCQPGTFVLTVKVTDRAGHAAEVRRTVTVFPPAS